MSPEREVEFHAALLELGSISCAHWLGFDSNGEPQAWKHRSDRSAFMLHKAKLIDWLVANNVAGRVFSHAAPPGGMEHALSSGAALWIGEFYQWLCEIQRGAS